MAIREIVLMGDPILRARAADVNAFDDELRRLVRNLFDTMYHADGIGLAAPQIGVGKRVLVVDVPDSDDEPGSRAALLNPTVVAASDERDRAAEGCLSIPGLEEVVERPARVEIHAFDPDGNAVTFDVGKLLSRALQHEIDHLDGVLFVDRVSALKRQMLLKKWRKLRAEEEVAPE